MSRNGDSLWKSRSFRKYYSFNLLTYFGSGIAIVALPFYIYEQTNSPMYTSLVAVSSSLPYLLFGLFAGALADSGNRKRIMILCDLLCAAVLASVPLAAMLNGQTSVIHLLLVGLLTSTCFVWFDSASHGALMQLVGRERLVAANSALISSDTVIKIGSPVISGFIISLFGAVWAIALTAFCYLLAAILISAIRSPFQGARSTGGGDERTNLIHRMRRDIGEGLRYIWSEPLIRSLTLVGFGNSFVGGAVTGLIVVFGAQVLGLADDAPQLGILYTCGSIGALIATLVLSPLRIRLKPGIITICGLIFSGLALLGLSLGGTIFSSSVFYLLWHLSNTLIIMNGITLRQQLTPDYLQGRVHASSRMIAYGGSPFGSLFGGAAATSLGIQPSYTTMSILMLILFVISLRTPLRSYVIPSD